MFTYRLAAAAALLGCFCVSTTNAALCGGEGLDECDCTDANAINMVNCIGKQLFHGNIVTFDQANPPKIVSLSNTGLLALSADYVKMGTDLMDMQELYLRDNGIVALTGEAFSGLASLRVLDLHHNQISEIEEDTFHLATSIEILDLSKNKLVYLKGGTFKELAKLHTLKLENNGLTGLPGKIFAQCADLEKLILTHNKLVSSGDNPLADTAFEGLVSLTELNLDSNLLTRIEADLLTPMTKLKDFYINKNDLTEVAPTAFAAQTELESVEMKDNKLTTLSEDVFKNIATLKSLKLGKKATGVGYWDCCNLTWMHEGNVPVTDLSSVECDQPETANRKNYNLGTTKLTLLKDYIDSDPDSTVSECLKQKPDEPAAPGVEGPPTLTSTSTTVTWGHVRGNAFSVDYFKVEYRDCTALNCTATTNHDQGWKVAQCVVGKYPPPVGTDRKKQKENCKVMTDRVVTSDSVSHPALDNDFEKNEEDYKAAKYALNIDGLNKFTAYEIRIDAHSDFDASGGGTWSGPGASTPFTTLADKPGVVNSPKATALSKDSIRLEWEPPSEPNGEITEYSITTTKSADGTVDEPITQPASEGTTYTVHGLTAFVEYTMTIKAATSEGEGPPVTVRTTTYQAPPVAPKAPVLQIECFNTVDFEDSGVFSGLADCSGGNINEAACDAIEGPNGGGGACTFWKQGGRAVESSKVYIQWNSVSEDDANGKIVGYTVYVTGGDDLTNVAVQHSLGVGGSYYIAGESKTKTIVTGLTPSTVYEFKVTAHTAQNGGESGQSPGLSVTTEQAAPEVMLAPTAKGLTPDQMEVKWDPPTISNGPIKGYNLRVYPCIVELREELRLKCQELKPGLKLMSDENATLELEFDGSSDDDMSSAARSKVVGSLKPATGYLLQVRSFNSLAASEYSPFSVGSTKESAPSEIYISQAIPLSATVISVSWTPPKNPNGVILGYSIYQVKASRTIAMYDDVVDDEEKLIGNTTTGLSFNHSGLDPYTTYAYTVTARSAAGESERVQASNARTYQGVPVQMANSPQISDVGTRQATVTWSKPKQPNGEITKFEIHGKQSENESPMFSGIPEEDVDGKLWLILGNLKPDQDYKFTVTAFTSKGASLRSPENTASTKSQSASAKIATLVTVLSIFVIILSMGFMWEHRLRRVTVEIDPMMPMAGSFGGNGSFPPITEKVGGGGGGGMGRGSGVGPGIMAVDPFAAAMQQPGNGYGQQTQAARQAPSLDPFAGLMVAGQDQERPGSPDSVSSASSASSASDSEA